MSTIYVEIPPKIPTQQEAYLGKIKNDTTYDPKTPLTSNIFGSDGPIEIIVGIRLIGNDLPERIGLERTNIEKMKKNNEKYTISFHSDESEVIMVVGVTHHVDTRSLITTVLKGSTKKHPCFEDLLDSDSAYVKCISEIYGRLLKKAYDISVTLGVRIESTSDQLNGQQIRIARPLFKKLFGVLDLAESVDGSLFGFCQCVDVVKVTKTAMMGPIENTQFTLNDKKSKLYRYSSMKNELIPMIRSKRDLKYITYDKYTEI